MRSLFIVGLAALGGCTEPEPPTEVETGVLLWGQGGGAIVQEFALRDGTHCAAVVGTYRAAISCDWGAPKGVKAVRNE